MVAVGSGGGSFAGTAVPTDGSVTTPKLAAAGSLVIPLNRLAPGADKQVLVMSGSSVAWADTSAVAIGRGDAQTQPALTVGTTRVVITTSPVTTLGFVVTAKSTNTASLFIGDNTITSAGGGGVFQEIQPGEAVAFDETSTSGWYLVATASGQTAYVGLVVPA